MEHCDYTSVMTTCKRHGYVLQCVLRCGDIVNPMFCLVPFSNSRSDPNLWVQALSFFSSRKECKEHIAEVLQHVEDGELMPPLMVIQALADSQFATLSDIKVMVKLEVLCVYIPRVVC